MQTVELPHLRAAASTAKYRGNCACVRRRAGLNGARLAQWRVANNFGKLQGELLDVVMAGPKMRKWYGQSSSNLPKDGGEPPEQEPEQQLPEEDGDRDYVLVTDADSPTGELVVLQLILLRAKIRILVKDVAAAKAGYGPYVEPISVDLNSAAGLSKALKNVWSVVVLGKLGAVLPAAEAAGVKRVVLLSTAGMPQPGGLAGLFQDAADAALKEPQREAAVAKSALPHVIVKAGIIQDVPGGSSSINLARAAAGAAVNSSSLGNSGGSSSIPREDLASAVVASAVYLNGPQGSSSSSSGGSDSGLQSLVFTVEAEGPGQPPESWEQLLDGLATARVNS